MSTVFRCYFFLSLQILSLYYEFCALHAAQVPKYSTEYPSTENPHIASTFSVAIGGVSVSTSTTLPQCTHRA